MPEPNLDRWAREVEEESKRGIKLAQSDFARGAVLLLLLHLLLQFPMTLLSSGMSVWFIGVTQLLYFPPTLVVLILKKETEMLKGLITAAGITFLLNATCTGIVFWLIR